MLITRYNLALAVGVRFITYIKGLIQLIEVQGKWERLVYTRRYEYLASCILSVIYYNLQSMIRFTVYDM